MLADTYPLRVLLMTFSGLVNHHQAGVIAYLVEENRVLKEQMTGRRLRLTDDQRRRLAAKAKLLGRRALDQVATIVTPDTLMKWHRRLIALKWTFAGGRVGRPGLMKAIKALIVRMAIENSSWGYCRIRLYGPPRVLEPVTLEYLSTETSGGLLIAVPQERAALLEEALAERNQLVRRIGSVLAPAGVAVQVV